MSLQNIFNDVIRQNNKNFNLGLNQKRFIGKVSTDVVNMGSTKGRGSTTRMLNYCRQFSEAPSECIKQFINITNLNPTDEIDTYITNYNELNNQFVEKFNLLVEKYNI